MGKNLKGKELGVGISQRKDGSYSARFVTVSGKRVQKYFPLLQDARKWLEEARLNDSKDGYVFTGYMTVDEWYNFWIVNIKEKTVRSNTVRNYRERYNRNIKKHLGKMRISEVKPMHCQLVLNEMDRDYAGSTIYQCLIAMYNMFESAYLNDVIPANPCKKNVKVTKPIIKKATVLAIDEQEAFLKAAKGSSNYNQYFFVLQTGVRTGEMIGLKWEDLDFERNMITINRTMEFRYDAEEWRIGPPKTKSSYRRIPMTTSNREMLLAMKKEHDKGERFEEEGFGDFVFLNRNGLPTKNSTYDTHLFKLADKAEIKRFSMHVLRHTFATRCIEAGMRPKTLQQLLGHSTINTTMNLYVHVTEDEQMKEMQKFELYDSTLI